MKKIILILIIIFCIEIPVFALDYLNGQFKKINTEYKLSSDFLKLENNKYLFYKNIIFDSKTNEIYKDTNIVLPNNFDDLDYYVYSLGSKLVVIPGDEELELGNKITIYDFDTKTTSFINLDLSDKILYNARKLNENKILLIFNSKRDNITLFQVYDIVENKFCNIDNKTKLSLTLFNQLGDDKMLFLAGTNKYVFYDFANNTYKNLKNIPKISPNIYRENTKIGKVIYYYTNREKKEIIVDIYNPQTDEYTNIIKIPLKESAINLYDSSIENIPQILVYNDDTIVIVIRQDNLCHEIWTYKLKTNDLKKVTNLLGKRYDFEIYKLGDNKILVKGGFRESREYNGGFEEDKRQEIVDLITGNDQFLDNSRLFKDEMILLKNGNVFFPNDELIFIPQN